MSPFPSPNLNPNPNPNPNPNRNPIPNPLPFGQEATSDDQPTVQSNLVP